MSERTKYAPGVFSWVDLSTTDQDAAKRFYGGLFGWEADDRPVGEGTVYSMMKLDDEVIELREWDVLRVAPQVVRSFEAGSDGLELIAIGSDRPEGGDGGMIPDHWSD